MRITRGQQIAGQDALVLRETLLRLGQRSFTARGIDVLLEEARARVGAHAEQTNPSREPGSLLNELLTAGLAEPDPQAGSVVFAQDEIEPHLPGGAATFRLTVAGYALAGASAARPMKRATAQRQLDEVLHRAVAHNGEALAGAVERRHLYGVGALVLFGSMLGEEPTVGDVDLAVGMCRVSDDATWRRLWSHHQDPEVEFKRYLKGARSRVSLVDLGQHRDFLASRPHRVLLLDPQVYARCSWSGNSNHPHLTSDGLVLASRSN